MTSAPTTSSTTTAAITLAEQQGLLRPTTERALGLWASDWACAQRFRADLRPPLLQPWPTGCS